MMCRSISCGCSTANDDGDDSNHADSFATQLLDALWFHPPLTPEQMFSEWRRELRGRRRQLVRGEWEIVKSLEKVKTEVTSAMRKQDRPALEAIQASLVQHERALSKLIEAKTRIDSLDTQLRRQAALVRVSKSFVASAEVFGLLNDMASVSELRELAKSMNESMLKAGLVDDLVVSALSDDDEKVSHEAVAHLDSVAADGVKEKLWRAPVANAELEAEYEQLGTTGLQNRLNALKMERAE